MKERIILHIDVNNAFLSWSAVDMLNNGSKIDIRNRYAIIAGNEKERKGIVLAKSNPCKKKGVQTAEPIFQARKKCPYLEIYPPNYKIYKYYSDEMYKYLLNYTDIIERYSIDECFLDYTDLVLLFGDPIKTAYKIKEDIKNKFGFTVNVGIGNNKLCAKMASDFEKPDKVHTLFTNEIKDKMWSLPVSDLFMIGKSSSKKLNELGILTIKDLATIDSSYLYKHFKNRANQMIESANGIDNSKVEYEYTDPKSISSSTSFAYNYKTKEEIYPILLELSKEITSKLKNKKMYTSNVSIWIKYTDFTKISKQTTLNNPTDEINDIYNNSIKLFNSIWNEDPIRALCVAISSFTKTNAVQLNLFNSNISKQKIVKHDEKLDKIVNELNSKYKDIITYASKIKKEGQYEQRNN